MQFQPNKKKRKEAKEKKMNYNKLMRSFNLFAQFYTLYNEIEIYFI